MESRIEDIGSVSFPAYGGTRIMMMPFHSHDPEGSIPEALSRYRDLVRVLVERIEAEAGVAYLTIDEAVVAAGETHRRPGLHVDGGEARAWGGGAAWAGSFHGGFVLASSETGCRGWVGSLDGEAVGCGGCEHLRPHLNTLEEIVMLPNRAYWCNTTALHESLPHERETRRQFLRISTPNNYPWYEGYTENPLGIHPTGNILPRREFMDYRP